jgi:hypothetical protein
LALAKSSTIAANSCSSLLVSSHSQTLMNI